MMSNILAGAAATFLVITLLAVTPIFGALFGAIAGWGVGIFFGPSILGTLGLTDVAMWQLGATLGFIGGFFKSVTTNGN